jgi:hypothetical protein
VTNNDLRNLLDRAADDGGRPPFDPGFLRTRGRAVRRRRAIAGVVAGTTAVVLVMALTGRAPAPAPDRALPRAPSYSPTPPPTTGTQSPSSSHPPDGLPPSASCVSAVLINGVAFYAVDAPLRVPSLSGRKIRALSLGCDEANGDGQTGIKISVRAIAGVEPADAVWWAGSILVREDIGRLPPLIDDLQRPPACSAFSPSTLIGHWLNVTQQAKMQFSGDFKPPLSITLQIVAVEPSTPGLERWSVTISDDGSAVPGLDRTMAEEALWSSRSMLQIEVHCDGSRFVADAFALGP